ncbi:MAG: four-helix bundle copper-binding protein [Proteobacteria bacterium]|nr:four-helix bundle copper-binding protein [Pseudomonadota bacterium]
MAVKEVLRDHGDQLRTEQLTAVIEAASDCAAHCEACADACLEEGDPKLTRCIRADLDCADICATTGTMASRRTGSNVEVLRSVIQACEQACRVCGEECGRHAEHEEHCRICAEACRRCAEACQQALSEVR